MSNEEHLSEIRDLLAQLVEINRANADRYARALEEQMATQRRAKRQIMIAFGAIVVLMVLMSLL